MSLRLPLSSSPVRELFDVADLATLGNFEGLRKLPTLRQALHAGREFLAANKAARSLHSIVLRGNGDVALIYVGPRGGWREVWNFGNPIA
jgi:hypothetical protein